MTPEEFEKLKGLSQKTRDAYRAFEIMRRRRCGVTPEVLGPRWFATDVYGYARAEGSDPVAAILAFDESERRAGR